MTRLRYRLRQVTDSFWFTPGVALLVAIGLAEGIVAVEPVIPSAIIDLVLTVGPDGSRGLLTAIATSMLSAAATMFSITIAVLTLTSSAYGPRLVRNFMADRGNQLVLALLVSTALFAMLVVRHIRAGESNEFVPHLAVNVAVLLAVASIVALVYFIHHISASIQISRLAGGVRTSLVGLLEELFPSDAGASGRPRADWPVFDGTVAVEAPRDGYVASIGVDRIVRAAAEHGGRVEVLVQPGTFVCRGDALARLAADAHGAGEEDGAAALDPIGAAVLAVVEIEDERTPVQDAEHLARQLVDVAARALSPGINDPVTAMTAVDALAAAFASSAGRPDPLPVRVDENGEPRVLARFRTVDGLAVDAVDAIRPYLGGQPVVAHRVLDLLHRLIQREPLARRIDAYQAAAVRVVDGAIEPTMLEVDAAALRRRLPLRSEATA